MNNPFTHVQWMFWYISAKYIISGMNFQFRMNHRRNLEFRQNFGRCQARRYEISRGYFYLSTQKKKVFSCLRFLWRSKMTRLTSSLDGYLLAKVRIVRSSILRLCQSLNLLLLSFFFCLLLELRALHDIYCEGSQTTCHLRK